MKRELVMACMWLAGLAGASPAYADVDEQVKQSTIDALTVKWLIYGARKMAMMPPSSSSV